MKFLGQGKLFLLIALAGFVLFQLKYFPPSEIRQGADVILHMTEENTENKNLGSYTHIFPLLS